MSHRIVLSVIILAIGVATMGMSSNIKVAAAKGTVSVRHGMQEHWLPVSVGEMLKPEDSIELQKDASAVVLFDGGNRLKLPDMVMIDLSDFRNLGRDELSLMLAMEQIRSAPARSDRDMLGIPRTTTVHGANRDTDAFHEKPDLSPGRMQLNGAKVLFDHGYFATSILRVKAVFNSYPALAGNVEARLLVARAFEKMQMFGEALGEYRSLSSLQLSPAVRKTVEDRVEYLKGGRAQSE